MFQSDDAAGLRRSTMSWVDSEPATSTTAATDRPMAAS